MGSLTFDCGTYSPCHGIMALCVCVCVCVCGALMQSWYDSRLTWDPEQYGGVRRLYVPPDELWLPDIVLYNRYLLVHTQTHDTDARHMPLL